MDYGWPVEMEVFQCVKELIGPIQHFAAFEGLSPDFQEPRQIVARDEFHDQELATILNKMVAHSWEGRVAQSGEQMRFSLKSPRQVIIIEQSLLESDCVA